MALILKVVDGPNLYLLEHGLFDPKPLLVEITVEYEYQGINYSKKLSLKLTGVNRLSDDNWMFSGVVDRRHPANTTLPSWVVYNTNPGNGISISSYDPTKRVGQVDGIREV